jgi:hypothetical protein
MKRRVAQLPLHHGRAPAWLFQRMTRLAGAIGMAIVDAYGPEEMLRRLADPWWFQAFGCVLGFDWHSSGLTTVTCGAMKEAAKRFGRDLGVLVAGGKAMEGRKTPREITEASDRLGIAGGDRLVYASRMSAKVDSAAVQDGYQIYHHSFFFTPAGAWCVVQQGMNEASRWARRYHWLGESVSDFVCEPHAGIHNMASSVIRHSSSVSLLNMVAAEAEANRQGSAALVRDPPDRLLAEAERLTEGPTLFAPAHHPVLPSDVNLDRLRKVIRVAHERDPKDFETLLGTGGVGAATVRSLSLLAELIYDAPASHRDPADRGRDTACRVPTTVEQGPRDSESPPARRWADYAFAHGGKDGHPFPVDRTTYDRNIQILLDAVRKSRVGETEKVDALRRLARYEGQA